MLAPLGPRGSLEMLSSLDSCINGPLQAVACSSRLDAYWAMSSERVAKAKQMPCTLFRLFFFQSVRTDRRSRDNAQRRQANPLQRWY
jgi:hypothetical protein